MKKAILLALLAALCGCCSYEIRTEGGKDVWRKIYQGMTTTTTILPSVTLVQAFPSADW